MPTKEAPPIVKVWRLCSTRIATIRAAGRQTANSAGDDDQTAGQGNPGGAEQDQQQGNGKQLAGGDEKAVIGEVCPQPLVIAVFFQRDHSQHLPALPRQMGEAPGQQQAEEAAER
jgi:hypothetical protein